jgi:hypothetical protein
MMKRDWLEKRCAQLKEKTSPGHAERVTEQNRASMRRNRRNRNSWHHEAADAFYLELVDRLKYVRGRR